MSVKKNGVYKTQAIDLSGDGQGICKVDNFTIFAEGLIPGDTAEVKIIKTNKTYGYAKVVKITEPSKDRIRANCGVFNKCGGCSLLHMNYNAQLKHKQKIVKDCLERIGGFKNTDKITEDIAGMDSPFNYRNKAQFPVKRNALHNYADIGFFAKRTHDVINLESCGISHEINEEIIKIFRDFINRNIARIPPYDEKNHTGLLRHIFTRVAFATGQIMVCIVINGDDIKNCGELITALKNIKGMTSIMLNINKNKSNVILGKTFKNLWGENYIIDFLCGKKFKISADSFYQVNPVQTEKLYLKALEFSGAGKDSICADAYCGIGTISLIFAPYVKKIYGVEVNTQAVDDAKENAKLNNIENAEFTAGKSEEVIPQIISGGVNIDLIILDPPRKGCDIKLINGIIESGIRKIIYISCSPATLARDLKLLTDKTGYELIKVGSFDMFPHTMHVEAIALIQL